MRAKSFSLRNLPALPDNQLNDHASFTENILQMTSDAIHLFQLLVPKQKSILATKINRFRQLRTNLENLESWETSGRFSQPRQSRHI